MTTSAPIRKTIDIPIVAPARVPKEPARLPEAIPAPLIIIPVKQPGRVPIRR